MPAPSSRIQLLLGLEIAVVLALSLGRSAFYAVLALIDAFTRGPLAEQTTALNRSASDRPWFDLVHQLANVAFALAPVALVLLLLTLTGTAAVRALGLDLRRPGKDLLWGVVLTACIGLPGLAIYYLGRALGATLEVIPAALDTHWWTVPVLVLHALKNALVEEVIVAGYLVLRLEQLGWKPVAIVAASALLRGLYHLYQGIGPGLANMLMGVVFAEWFRRTRRTMPLVIAHTLLDVVAFVGYALLRDYIST
ncbi:MAG: CPBP family intramembrane metalloprotease domain-containing protein [Brachybacterium faecium]|nr:MAG: CPBP family intramembrane metalloprotease domain-containing protein [Brachybacterium faecium]